MLGFPCLSACFPWRLCLIFIPSLIRIGPVRWEGGVRARVVERLSRRMRWAVGRGRSTIDDGCDGDDCDDGGWGGGALVVVLSNKSRNMSDSCSLWLSSGLALLCTFGVYCEHAAAALCVLHDAWPCSHLSHALSLIVFVHVFSRDFSRCRPILRGSSFAPRYADTVPTTMGYLVALRIV